MARYFPNLIQEEQPGQRTKPATEDLDQLRDQFSPFVIPRFGCDPFNNPAFDGTLFRFPLRTEAQAARSTLRPRQPCTTMDVERLFDQFEAQAEHILLFLTCVRDVELLVWEEGAESPVLRQKITLSSPDLSYRSELGGLLQTRMDQWAAPTRINWRTEPTALTDAMATMRPSEFPRRTIKIMVDVQNGDGLSKRREWWVRSGIGCKESWKLAADPSAFSLARVGVLFLCSSFCPITSLSRFCARVPAENCVFVLIRTLSCACDACVAPSKPNDFLDFLL